MRIGKVTETIQTLYNNEATRKRTLFLIGKSGIGKSQTVYQAAAALREEYGEFGVYDLRLSTSDPTDFGLLMPENGELVRQKPDFIRVMEKCERGFLFLDEISSAPPAVQAPAYQVTLDRACNGFPIPDGWMVISGGNHQSDRGVTYNIAAPLLNRMRKVEVETVLDDVLEHGARNGLDPRIMAFLKLRSDFLHKFDPKETGEQFPTPRSWFAVSDTLQLQVSDAVRVELTKGDVGHEAAASFEEFLRVWETMPNLDRIFTKPEEVEVPERLDVRYCVAMGLSARLDKGNFSTAWQFIQRMPKEHQVLIVKLAYQRDRKLAQSPAFSEWATVNTDAFERG